MRDYANIDKYLDQLAKDVYPQPQDNGHSVLAKESIDYTVPKTHDVKTVLDAGCGEGFCQEYFEKYGIEYTGIALRRDYEVAVENGRNVFEIDFSFLPFEDNSFDMLYSRHSLEHSPFPLMTLMEWKRVSEKYVSLVLPAPEHWKFVGRNHYFVLLMEQWQNLFGVVGLDVVDVLVKRQKMTENKDDPEVAIEYWYLLEKK